MARKKADEHVPGSRWHRRDLKKRKRMVVQGKSVFRLKELARRKRVQGTGSRVQGRTRNSSHH